MCLGFVTEKWVTILISTGEEERLRSHSLGQAAGFLSEHFCNLLRMNYRKCNLGCAAFLQS